MDHSLQLLPQGRANWSERDAEMTPLHSKKTFFPSSWQGPHSLRRIFQSAPERPSS